MPRVQWLLTWKLLLQLLFAGLANVVVIMIADLDKPISIFAAIAVTSIISLAVFQILWTKTDKYIRKNQINLKIWNILRPAISYSWEVEDGNLWLQVTGYPKKKRLILMLVCYHLKMVSGIKEQQDSIAEAFRGIPQEKRLIFKKDLLPENLESVKIRITTKTANNKTAFCFAEGSNGVEAFPGNYYYQLEEIINYGNRIYGNKSIPKNFTVNSLGKVEL